MDKQEYHKQYYQQHKTYLQEKLRQHKDEMRFCEICKKNVKYFSVSAHRKSEKHKKNEEQYNNTDKVTEQKILSVLRKIIDF
jgi:hypothetical protein